MAYGNQGFIDLRALVFDPDLEAIVTNASAEVYALSRALAAAATQEQRLAGERSIARTIEAFSALDAVREKFPIFHRLAPAVRRHSLTYTGKTVRKERWEEFQRRNAAA